jgi:hypothetical protein
MAYISPEMARNDPQAFKAGVVEHMAEMTELGGVLWNTLVDRGVVDYAQFQLDPDTWFSGSKGNGFLSLGTAPMSNQQKATLLYRGEDLSYPAEVTRRLVHELGHGALFAAQNEPGMHTLHQLAYDIRGEGDRGLSALGSSRYYRDRTTRAGEDVAELLTERTTSADRLRGYADFLAMPEYEEVRSQAGLITLGSRDEAQTLSEVVDTALYDVLS